jgi:hypothetical protein
MHVTGVPGAHVPPWQESPWVHTLLSVHELPFVAGGFEQTPEPGSHTPGTWHWSLAVQVTGVEPVQTPATHASVCVQALPSLHALPLRGVFTHVPVAPLQLAL